MKRLLPLIFLLVAFTAQAQTKLSNKPADFIGDVKTLLTAGKVADAEKLSADMEGVWNSGKLSSKQQQQIMDISQLMYRKRIGSAQFGQFYTMVTAGVNNKSMRADQVDKMLEVTEKAVQQEDAKRLGQFLTTSSSYLSNNLLYQNSYYKLLSSGGSFSFAYEGASKATPEEAEESNGWDSVSWDDEGKTQEEAVEDDDWGIVTATPKKEDKKKTAQARKESLKRQFLPAQPKVSGPVLKLEKTDLTFVTPWDSASINNTQGQLMLVNNLFVGEGGKFEWKLKEEPASAEIRKYNFNISFAGFKAPDVTVAYPAVLAAPVDGAFEWISSKRKTSSYPYPKFNSFTSDAKINNLGPQVAYKGGFSLVGNAIGSKPMDGSPSEIVVSHNGERKFRSLARSYSFEDSLLLANRAAVAIYQQKDSLVHPAMQLRYSRVNQELTLTKDKGAYADAPFIDNFHQMEIMAERLQWKLNEPNVEFSVLNSKTLVPVQLESMEYFSNSRYQRLVGVAQFHPLQILVGYGLKAKTKTFYASDVAKTTKIGEAAIKEAAQAMSYQDYVSYDPASGYIELKPKALHYVGSSRDAKDYDHIIIKSVVPSGRNATLNLDDNKLTVRGVDRIVFNNDTASVYMLPRGNEIRILQNRDIEFNGQVYASSLAIKGSDFKFNYKDFTIELANIDTVALVTGKRRGRNGNVTDQVLTSNKGGMSGTLYINKPGNKSGKQYFAEYPKFDAVSGARVAFARPDVAGGAYDSTIYFEMPPFKLDSLSSTKNAIGFDGTFNSGGIFPPIKTKMVMMPDETLGFYYQPGEKGLPAYGGKGMVYDTIMMNSGGIQSKGTLTYLNATLEAPAYTYYKNGVTAEGGTSVTMTEGQHNGAEYPVATLQGFSMNWQTQADTMYLQTVNEPMKLYEEGFALTGVAKLTPGGLQGSGVVDNPVANVTSQELTFKQRSFSGNHAQMLVKSDVEGRPAVKAQDVAFAYDMVGGVVDFASEQKGVANMEFPKAQYKTSMSSARWDMKEQKVALKADENGGKNWFYSLHPAQEGLRFIAASGEYDLKSNNLLAGGVPYIAVGDAHMVPDSGRVAVAADATIQTLRNALVLADSTQQYHRFYKGNIDVLSRTALRGSAVLDYYNAAADSFQLQFSDFVYGDPTENVEGKKAKKEKIAYTFASASMEEDKPFYVFPRILYRGKVMMRAPIQHLDFDGELKMNFTGNPDDSEWFPYKKDSLDPMNVRIPIIEPKAADGTMLHTGLHIGAGSGKIYNTFVSRKQAEDDLDLFTVDGLLSYNNDRKEFKIGHEKRAYGDAYEGSMLIYNEEANAVHFEGKLNLLKPVKNFAVEASGSGNARMDSSEYDLDAFLVFDMDVPEKALAAMAANLRAGAAGAAPAIENSDALLYKLGEFVGDKEVRRYVQQSATSHVPLPKLSKKLMRSLILSDVKLQWSNDHRAWYSAGSIGLASILKEDVNTRMNGYIEMREDMNGLPAVNLYLQSDPYTWYYFSFFENGMTMASSDDKFNKAVESKARGSRGSTSSYGIYAGAPIEKNEFVQYFRDNYLNGEEGFKVATEQVIIEPTGNFDYLEEEPKKSKKKNRNDPSEEEPEIDMQ
ncbi:hypothetical protein DXT99_15965 [Pontibacter diazotrophicus]|uniref:Uncharacterized protein n=1 Tax=Pontibacter diazotrophicus TaxID=1400979 RepID=A0A3D8L9P7_9BACT|nr:hypothetical protein [Pontibacter diazotrophicus]RDV14064.1 hypothetical protein DXT99_15965 [Pontibacter diazotrophicus]